MQDRAAREAAERERLRQQNEMARHAARQRALQEKQQQELTQPLTQASHRQRQAVSTAQSSAYLQRLRGRQPCQQLGHARLPEWARAARPLPPLLPLGTKPQPGQPQQASPPSPAHAVGAADAADARPFSEAAAQHFRAENSCSSGHWTRRRCSCKHPWQPWMPSWHREVRALPLYRWQCCCS